MKTKRFMEVIEYKRSYRRKAFLLFRFLHCIFNEKDRIENSFKEEICCDNRL